MYVTYIKLRNLWRILGVLIKFPEFHRKAALITL
jgi:hypothetical protein